MLENTKPYGGSSAQRLVDLINAANGSNLQEGVDFRFGALKAVDSGEGFNTRVRLHRLSERYGSDVDIEYVRRPISDLEELPERWIVSPNVRAPFRVHDVLHEFNNATGLDLLPHEVENTYYPEERDDYRITITDSSLAWLPGSYYDVRIKEIWLDMAVLITDLDGLYAPRRLP